MNLIGIQVSHAKWGIGRIIAQEGVCLTVEFPDTTTRFIYPDAIGKFIKATDPNVQAAILQEIEDTKAAAIAQQKAAEAAKQVEIDKQIVATTIKRASLKSNSIPQKVASQQKRLAGKPMTFFVFQNSTFDREYQGGYLWAPVTSKSGNMFHHWDRLSDVHPGDIILHGYNGYVQAVSVARTACYDCVQPKELRAEDSWDTDGRRVDSDYIMLQHPIKTAAHIDNIIRLCNTKYAPFNKYGTGNQGYLFEINREMAKIFLDAAVSANPYLKDSKVIIDLLSE